MSKTVYDMNGLYEIPLAWIGRKWHGDSGVCLHGIPMDVWSSM